MRGFNIQEFRSVVDGNRQLLRNNKFLVDIPPPRKLVGALGGALTPGGSPLSFYVKQFPLPGIGILTDDVIRYGYGPINRTPYGIVFNDAMMHCYVDANNQVRRWFRLWTRSILEADMPMGIRSRNGITGTDAYEFGYKEDYAVDIRVTVFDSEGNPAISVVLCEAFPNYVGETYQDWSDKNTVMMLPVSMTFRDWYEENVTTASSAQATSLLP